jgi:hypothetical protein
MELACRQDDADRGAGQAERLVGGVDPWRRAIVVVQVARGAT